LRCGRFSEHLPEVERIVAWAAVGVCPEGTRHDLKDVTGRMAGWGDRPVDRLPERRHVVYVRSGGVSVVAAVELLRRLDVDDFTLNEPVLRFERYAHSVAEAVRTVMLDCEFVGLDVTGVSAG
jgi:hypothetical protein